MRFVLERDACRLGFIAFDLMDHLRETGINDALTELQLPVSQELLEFMKREVERSHQQIYTLKDEVESLKEQLLVWVPPPGEFRTYCVYCGVNTPKFPPKK